MFEQSFVADQKARTAKLSLGLCFYSLAKPLYSNFLIFSLGEKHHNILRWTISLNLLPYTWQVKKSDLESTPRIWLAKAGLAVWYLERAALLERTAAPGQQQQLAPHLPSPALPSAFLLPLLSKLMKGEATSWKGMAKTPERAFKAPLLCSKVLLWLLPVCRELGYGLQSSYKERRQRNRCAFCRDLRYCFFPVLAGKHKVQKHAWPGANAGIQVYLDVI